MLETYNLSTQFTINNFAKLSCVFGQSNQVVDILQKLVDNLMNLNAPNDDCSSTVNSGSNHSLAITMKSSLKYDFYPYAKKIEVFKPAKENCPQQFSLKVLGPEEACKISKLIEKQLKEGESAKNLIIIANPHPSYAPYELNNAPCGAIASEGENFKTGLFLFAETPCTYNCEMLASRFFIWCGITRDNLRSFYEKILKPLKLCEYNDLILMMEECIQEGMYTWLVIDKTNLKYNPNGIAENVFFKWTLKA